MNAAPALVAPSETEYVVRSALLGTLQVPEAQIFGFDHGVLGFPKARRFALVPVRTDGLFWLQSTDFEALTFLLADPFGLVEGYAVELGGHELGDLAPNEPADLLVLSILTLPPAPDEPATANLQGPLAFNLSERRGRQIVLQDSPWGVRWPVALPGHSQG